MTDFVDRATAAARLRAAQNVLILCHKNPDGDTIGCAGALYHALQYLGKTAAVLRSAEAALAGRLIVVDDAHLLDRLSATLLHRLAVGVGKDVVRRIRVVGPSGPSWRHGPRHVRGRGPRDTYG